MNTKLNQLQRLLAEIDSLMGSVEVSALIRDARSGALKARRVTAKAIKLLQELQSSEPEKDRTGFCGDPYVHDCGRPDCPTSDSYQAVSATQGGDGHA